MYQSSIRTGTRRMTTKPQQTIHRKVAYPNSNSIWRHKTNSRQSPSLQSNDSFTCTHLNTIRCHFIALNRKCDIIEFMVIQSALTNFKQQFNFMKTRSRPIAPSVSDTSPAKIQPEEQQLLELSRPLKKLKEHSEFPLSGKKNAYELIPEIPTIQLTVADMKGDPLELMASLQLKYGEFGAVKLVCPKEWNPSQELKYPKIKITSRVQPIHQLRFGKPFEEKKQAYSLTSFHDLASEFERRYRPRFQEQGGSRLGKLQSQYWRLVNGVDEATQALNPKKYKVTVEYAADLPANKYGSGFPQTLMSKVKDENFNYAESLYNLNNIYRSGKSLLGISDRRGQSIGGITIPWVYIGMMFSTFCWHVEDSCINSINYNHFGGTKIWYFIPAKDKISFDKFIAEKFGKKDIINKITYMIDPLQLMERGIKVFKAYHQPKSFICTFFKAYHCGFSDSFNLGEAINFVLPESLSYIKEAIEHATRPSVFCYEWLVYENYLCGLVTADKSFSQVKKEYLWILEKEKRSIAKLLQRLPIGKTEEISDKTKYTRHMCSKCKNYLYLSFVTCQACRKDYCLKDAEHCCEGSHLKLMLRKANEDRQKYLPG